MNLKQTLTLAATTCGLAVAVLPAQAETFNIQFSYLGGPSNLSSGTGSFTINDGVLVPNLPLADILADVTAFTATFTNLAQSPTPTIFSLSDLSVLGLATDANANVTDIAILSNTNTDGYDLFTPVPNFQFLSGNNPDPTVYTVTVQPAQAVPESSSILGTVTALGFGIALKRKGKRQ